MSRKIIEIGHVTENGFKKICDCPSDGVKWLFHEDGTPRKVSVGPEEEIPVDLYVKYEDGKTRKVTFVIDNPCEGESGFYMGLSCTEDRIVFHARTKEEITYDITSVIKEETQTMRILNEYGEEEEVEVVVAYEDTEAGCEYVAYTKNEISGDGEETIYVSKVDRSTGSVRLLNIPESEWNRVQLILDKLAE